MTFRYLLLLALAAAACSSAPSGTPDAGTPDAGTTTLQRTGLGAPPTLERPPTGPGLPDSLRPPKD